MTGWNAARSHLPPYHIPQSHPSVLALSTLSHASNLDWRSVSHTIIYMFQCYSRKSSHPRLLPQSPKDCLFFAVSCIGSSFSSVHFRSVAQLCLTLSDPMNHSTPGLLSITNAQSPSKPMSIVLVMPSDHPSSVIPISCRLQSFPASGSFPMSHFLASISLHNCI